MLFDPIVEQILEYAADFDPLPDFRQIVADSNALVEFQQRAFDNMQLDRYDDDNNDDNDEQLTLTMPLDVDLQQPAEARADDGGAGIM